MACIPQAWKRCTLSLRRPPPTPPPAAGAKKPAAFVAQVPVAALARWPQPSPVIAGTSSASMGYKARVQEGSGAGIGGDLHLHPAVGGVAAPAVRLPVPHTGSPPLTLPLLQGIETGYLRSGTVPLKTVEVEGCKEQTFQ